MSKSTPSTLFLLGLLFAFLAQAGRTEPADGAKASPKPLGAAAEEKPVAAAAKGCRDECMMRRTLEAHLDYIYTQEKKN